MRQAELKGILELKEVVGFVLDEAQRQGASQCEADVSVSQGLSLTVRLGEVDTIEYQRDRGLGLSGTSHSVSCTLIAQQGDEMQRDYWYTTARDPADLEPVDVIGRTAGERTVARLGSRKLTTRKAPIAFTPDMARGLFKHFVGA